MNALDRARECMEAAESEVAHGDDYAAVHSLLTAAAALAGPKHCTMLTCLRNYIEADVMLAAAFRR
ncbi:MAG: hypothetical protein WD795_05200 [Woeseia sp.]